MGEGEEGMGALAVLDGVADEAAFVTAVDIHAFMHPQIEGRLGGSVRVADEIKEALPQDFLVAKPVAG
jgi:hypothetical protein